MNDRIDNRDSADLECLEAPVFRYLASKSPTAVADLVQTLAAVGDVASLRNALASGAIWSNEELATKTTRGLLTSYLAELEIPIATPQETQEICDLCIDWIQAGTNSGHPTLARQILESMLKDKVNASDLGTVMTILGKPQFGIDVNEIVPINSADTWHLDVEDRPGESLLGKFIDRGMAPLALRLAGTNLTEFPVTRRDRHPINLATQAVFASRPKPEVLSKLVGMLAQDAPDAWLQLGDIVTASVGKASPTLRGNPVLEEPAISTHIQLYTQGEKESLPWAIALLGAGAQLRHPDLVWEGIRTISLHVRYDNAQGRVQDGPLPLPHAMIFTHPSEVDPTIVSAALKRMVTEGGLDVNAKDGNGRTLLQSAAKIGNMEVVGALLELGAETRYDQHAAYPAAAAQIAKERGYHDVEALILAHEAHQAIERTRQAASLAAAKAGEGT
jgi:hypothetical protein